MERLLVSPEAKHAMATAMLRRSNDVEGTRIFQQVTEAIANSPGSQKKAPLVLLGISTYEYCIVQLNTIVVTKEMVAVINYLRGEGFFTDVYKTLCNIDDNDTRSLVLVVCWDPVVTNRGFLPKTYKIREGVRVPCAKCSKVNASERKDCDGCEVLRMWVVDGVFGRHAKSPCKICSGTQTKPEFCAGCPAKALASLTCPEGKGVSCES